MSTTVQDVIAHAMARCENSDNFNSVAISAAKAFAAAEAAYSDEFIRLSSEAIPTSEK